MSKDLPSPRDYRGVKGTGEHDDADGMQQFYDDVNVVGVGRGTKGTYGVSRTLIVTGGRVDGDGRHAFVTKKLKGFPPNKQLILNMNVTVGDYVDHDIEFNHCGFEGLPDEAVDGNIQLLGFAGVRDLCLRDCFFGHHRWMLVSIENCYRPRVDANHWTDWGARSLVDVPGDFVYEGGPALYMWENSGKFNILPWVTNNHFYDGEWIAMSFQGKLGHISGNTAERCCEAGFFGAFDLGVDHDNITTGVRCKDGSAHARETGGVKTIFALNVMDDTDLAGIWLTNPEAVLVALNIITRANQKAGLTAASAPAAISTRSTTGKPIDAQILYNMIGDMKVGEKVLAVAGAKVLGN